MSLTVVTSGTTSSLVIGTETNLESARAPGSATTYVYAIDTAALVSPETLFIRIYFVLLASGTERLAYFASVVGGADIDLQQISVPVPMDTGTGITIRATLQQKNGAGRTFPWKLYSL